MSNVSDENKTIAKTLVKAFGGTPRVQRFWDEEEKSFVDILTCSERPERGVTCYSTIGLSDTPLLKDGAEYPTRLEIVGACGSGFTGFDNALSTAAFCIINSSWFCYPGAIFPDVLKMYEISPTMSHLMFVPPFLWEEELQTTVLKSKTVSWLLSVPISEKELLFAEENGTDALEKLFADMQVDIYDLERNSVV